MSTLHVVTCTRAKTIKEFEERPLSKGLQVLADSHQVDFHIFRDNTKGLPERYNEILRDPKYAKKMVLFVHDDVELQDLFLVEKLVESPYAITGIAGTKSFSKAAPNAAWHIASNREDWVGEAGHCDKEGRVWTTVFGPTKSRALIIDGLFMCVNVPDLTEKGLYFDTDFPFHHYDLSFCLRANEKKVSCGVLPVHVVHHGLGDSMNTPEWAASNEKFKATYCCNDPEPRTV